MCFVQFGGDKEVSTSLVICLKDSMDGCSQEAMQA